MYKCKRGELSVRARNILHSEGIENRNELIAKINAGFDLGTLPNCGPTTQTEILIYAGFDAAKPAPKRRKPSEEGIKRALTTLVNSGMNEGQIVNALSIRKREIDEEMERKAEKSRSGVDGCRRNADFLNALKMREGGMTYAEIGRNLTNFRTGRKGVSQARAMQIVFQAERLKRAGDI